MADNEKRTVKPAPLQGRGLGEGSRHENDGLGETPAPHPDPLPEGEREFAAERTCILTRAIGERAALIRLAVSADGAVLPDVRAKAPGRGAWIGVDRATLEQAQGKGKLKGALARAFKGRALAVPDDLGARIAAALERAFLDRLGLEARAGHLLTGSDRIEEAARKGRLHALYHASDAGADGGRKLAQAWRVGRGAEGSDLAGVALPSPRTILAMALGRENVVHVGVVDHAAAARVHHALARWRRFIGPDVTDMRRDGSRGIAGTPDDVAGELGTR